MGSMQGDDLQLQGDLACENAEIRGELKVGGSIVGSSVVPSEHVAIVDPVLGNDAAGQFGNLARAFKTIQAALDQIPSPTNAPTARAVWTVIVSPATYDEDLSVDLTGGKHVIIASWGPWNLGTFNAADWQPSGVRRNITITTSSNVVYDTIRPAFSMQPMLPAGEALTTHQAYVTRPRISGAIDLSGVAGGTPSLELTLSCEIFGTTGGSGGDSLVGGATIVQSYIYHSRLRGKLTGANWNFQINERTRFGGLVTVSGYSTILSCRFDAGMTTTSAANAGILPGGFYDSDFAGTFTGPAGALRLDGATDYWFRSNGAVLAGGATKALQESVTQQATLWPDERTVIAGAALASAISAAQLYNQASFQVPAASGDITQIGFWLTAGTYTFGILTARGSSYGIVQFSIDGANVGAPQDLYDAVGASNVFLTIGPIVLVTSGQHTLRATCTGKNGASSDFTLPFTKFSIR